MPPLDNVTAFVVGMGRDLPADRLHRLEGYMTIGVGRVWPTGFVPTVSFWTDADTYTENPAHFDRTLCVCDRSAAAGAEHIALPVRSGRLPRRPSPNYLHRLDKPVAVAALWAVGLGCYPVILLGAGCEDGGDLGRLLAMRYRPSGMHHPTLWAWSADAGEFDDNMNHRHVQPARVGEMVARIREYFAHGTI